jgi:hypothetical protein
MSRTGRPSFWFDSARALYGERTACRIGILDFLKFREAEHPGQRNTAASIVNRFARIGIDGSKAYGYFRELLAEGIIAGEECAGYTLTEKQPTATGQ